MKQPAITTIYQAAAVRDALGCSARPGFVAVAAGRIVAAGKLADMPAAGGVQLIHLPTSLLLPRLVNAHTHLDLTALGPRVFSGSFVAWIKQIIASRPAGDEQIAASVRLGIELSLRSGVGWVGDIAGSPAAVRARAGTGPQDLVNKPAQRPLEAIRRRLKGVATRGGKSATAPPPVQADSAALPGVSYLECFGIGAGEADAIDRLEAMLKVLPFETPVVGSERGVLLGIQPHAPYSAGPALYRKAAELSQRHAYRLCTHLAESQEEFDFVAHGTGGLAQLLQEMGKAPGEFVATGLHPVDLLEPVLRRGRWLLAHCNYLEEHHLRLLAKAQASVVYCPIASDYFGHHQPEKGHRHPYRELLAARVNVCLGTDSILCQHPDEPQPLGLLPQMRHLYRRDGADPDLLLQMASVNGLLAMELNEKLSSLQPGAPGQLIAVDIDPEDSTDPLQQVLSNDNLAQVVDEAMVDLAR